MKGTIPGRNESRTKENHVGFTLVEVLLALVLTGILLAGIYNIFGSQEKSQVLVDQMAELNQNLRVAATMITRDMRMAGHGMENGQATRDSDGEPEDAITITDGVITLRYGTDSENLGENDLVLVTDGVSARILTYGQASRSGSRIMRLVEKEYRVDTCDDNPREYPCLKMNGQALVDYIEDLQVNPTTSNQRSYTVTLTARTRKPLPGIGGIRRRSITETVRVRNIP